VELPIPRHTDAVTPRSARSGIPRSASGSSTCTASPTSRGCGFRRASG